MGQTSSSAVPNHMGGSHMLRKAAKGEIDLSIAREPLLLLHTTFSGGHTLVHVLAREGHNQALQLLIAALHSHSTVLAEAISRLHDEDAKATGAWWRMLLLGPRGPTEDVLQQLQNPDRVVSTLLSWPGSRGVTPLMLACRAGHAACVAILLDNGADPLLLDSITRRSCLHYAAAAGQASCVNVLLNEYRTVTVQQGGNSRQVLLQHALMRDGVQGISKYVDLCTSTGFAALHYAAFWGHTSTLRALLVAGANSMLPTANGLGSTSTELLVDTGNTALHLAAENGQVMAVAILLLAHAHTMSQRYPPSPHSQQRQPWEGDWRRDPRAAINSNGDTPHALAVAARRSRALLLLLDCTLPLASVLESAGLMRRGQACMFGVPKLAILAKSVLDKHLGTCLDQLEARQQQQQEPAAESDGEAPAAESDPVAVTAAAAADGGNDHDNHDGGMENKCMATPFSLPIATADVPRDRSAPVSCGSIRPSSSTSCLAGSCGSACELIVLQDIAIINKSSSCPNLTGHCTSGIPGDCASSSSSRRILPLLACLPRSDAANWQAVCNNISRSSDCNSTGYAPMLDTTCSEAGDGSSCFDTTCCICFELPNAVILAGCRHTLCFGCARSILAATTTIKPAACPFCRQSVGGFLAV